MRLILFRGLLIRKTLKSILESEKKKEKKMKY